MARGIFDDVSQSVNAEASEQESHAFALKLQSAKLEQEHENRLSEAAAGTQSEKDLATFKEGLSSVPGSQFSKIGKYANDSAQALRDRKPFPQLDASDITHPAAQQMLERVQGQLAHASAAMLPVSIHPINANGHSITNVYDKGGNLISQNDNGLNTEGAAAVNKAEAAYGTYTANLANAKSKLNSFISANSAGKLPGQIASITLEKFMQSNPEVKTYFDQLPLMSLKGEVDLTHSARAVSALGKSAAEAYPQSTDTVAVAQDKLNSLTQVGRDGLDSTYQAYGVDPKQQHFPNLNLQEQLKQQKAAGGQDAAGKDNASRAERIRAALMAAHQSK